MLYLFFKILLILTFLFLLACLLAWWFASGFPEAGPDLEQTRILEEITNLVRGKWPPSAIRRFWILIGFKRSKKSKIIKKYKLEKLDFQNPFLIKYLFFIFDEELIPRLEYKKEEWKQAFEEAKIPRLEYKGE